MKTECEEECERGCDTYTYNKNAEKSGGSFGRVDHVIVADIHSVQQQTCQMYVQRRKLSS
jgi:hypothetical protein